MKKLLLEDLSAELGCSKTLISMVLNGKGNQYGISQKTQAIVLETIERLNYSPTKFAKSLSESKSNFIGLIVGDMSSPFYTEIAETIENALFRCNYNVMIFSNDENEKKENLLVDSMVRRKSVDGLIVASTHRNSEFYEQSKFSNTPIVFIDRVIPLFNANYVVIDNYGGSAAIVSRLAKLGFKTIACFASTPLYISTTEDRLNGYRNAVYKNDLTKSEQLIKIIDLARGMEDVERGLRELKDTGKQIDVFFALNNRVAIGLLKALKKEEFAIFSRAKIACFDDIDLFNIIDRKVISVSQPIEEIGKSAASLILDLISGKQKEKTCKVLSTRLIER